MAKDSQRQTNWFSENKFGRSRMHRKTERNRPRKYRESTMKTSAGVSHQTTACPSRAVRVSSLDRQSVTKGLSQRREQSLLDATSPHALICTSKRPSSFVRQAHINSFLSLGNSNLRRSLPFPLTILSRGFLYLHQELLLPRFLLAVVLFLVVYLLLLSFLMC